MRRRLALLALAAVLGGCATGSGPSPVAGRGDAAVDRGRRLALHACAVCHAVEAGARSPSPAAPSFALVRLRHNEISLERQLTDISRKGHWEMPPLQMSDEQIRDLTAYIQTVEPTS